MRQAAFDGPWLKTDPKTTMFIVIFLERCQRPLRVTAGKIFTLSLDTYTYVRILYRDYLIAFKIFSVNTVKIY